MNNEANELKMAN